MLDFSNVYHVLLIAFAAVALGLHWCSVFLTHKGSAAYLPVNLGVHIALFAFCAIGGLTLDFTFLVFMASVFVYTVMGTVRYLIWKKTIKTSDIEGGDGE